jgi:hypothetical protein
MHGSRAVDVHARACVCSACCIAVRNPRIGGRCTAPVGQVMSWVASPAWLVEDPHRTQHELNQAHKPDTPKSWAAFPCKASVLAAATSCICKEWERKLAALYAAPREAFAQGACKAQHARNIVVVLEDRVTERLRPWDPSVPLSPAAVWAHHQQLPGPALAENGVRETPFHGEFYPWRTHAGSTVHSSGAGAA